MFKEAITADQTERLLAVLERIAAALEWVNFKTPMPLASGISALATTGFTCDSCGVFVPWGGSHNCPGFIISAGSVGSDFPGCGGSCNCHGGDGA